MKLASDLFQVLFCFLNKTIYLVRGDIIRPTITFEKIWDYLSEDTGNVITIGLPWILVNDEKLGIQAFTLSHESAFGIEGMERQYSETTSVEIWKTKIKDLNELSIAKK